MSANPIIAFCTTCKGRTQHLEVTLPKNLVDNEDYSNCKFIVLDYNSPDNLISYLRSEHDSDIDSGRLCVYSMLPNGDGSHHPFRMTHAKNMAHRLGLLEGADILVNLDADNFTCPGFASYIADQVKENTYLWAKMEPGKFRRGISGRIVVTKKAFLNAGGYDEKHDTWWSDDKDFNARLQRLGQTGKEIHEQYLDAISHNNKMRFKEYKHVETNLHEDDFDLSDADSTVVNFGNLGCGTVFKNFDFENPIKLDPIPTRIFGIGMHKTATTSLHAALTLLGYDSAHWKTAHWAKAIWLEMTGIGKSSTLEQHYALSDLPITVLYRELDKAYPGSKFILTKKHPNKWLESVRAHFTYNLNKFRKCWDHDPFSHLIHKYIYGRKDFDEDTFLTRYFKHNNDVIAYFKDRPNDLLVMNMDDGDGWSKLCKFLGREIPNIDYPKYNRKA